MNGNFGGLSAELVNCQVESRDIPEMGIVPAVFSQGGACSVLIYDIDTQGSIEDFLSENGNYFLLSYNGEMPTLTYEYHIDGVSEGDIFKIGLLEDRKGIVEYNPNDDLLTGTVKAEFEMTQITGERFEEALNDKLDYKRRSFLIHLSSGGKSEDGECVKEYLDIKALSEKGVMTHLARSFTDAAVLGTVRKRIRIDFDDDTSLVSFSKGTIVLDMPCSTSREGRLDPEVAINSDKPGLKAMYKNLLKPNKIFNTEANI